MSSFHRITSKNRLEFINLVNNFDGHKFALKRKSLLTTERADIEVKKPSIKLLFLQNFKTFSHKFPDKETGNQFVEKGNTHICINLKCLMDRRDRLLDRLIDVTSLILVDFSSTSVIYWRIS